MNMTVIKKSKEENSLQQIRKESSRYNPFQMGVGAHKNKKYDKKDRRREGKKICRDY